MAFTVPTLDEIHDFKIALLKALLPGADVSRNSFLWLWTRSEGGGIADNHAHIAGVLEELLPDSAADAYLERWGTILGIAKKTATPARKANALRVYGTVAATVAVGNALTHESGQTFQVNENETIPAAGYVDVDVLAISTGSTTRLSAGEVLTFDAPPAGIVESTELQVDIDEDGDDEEQDGPYRLRILDRFRRPPLGGAQNDYVQWALEVTGVASAYCYPNRAGYGTVDLAALHVGSGSSRLLSAGEVAELQAYIDELRPVGVLGFRVLEVIEQPQSVELLIRSTGEAAYEWDWDDATPPIVSAWNGTTRLLTFTLDRPDTMKPGDRLAIKTTSGSGSGESYVIESLSGAAAVYLEAVPAVAPVATDTIYSGGPLTEPTRDAVLALIDGFGTANPDATRYGDWEGALRVSSLYRASNGVGGVLDSSVVLPVATIEADDPAFPADGTIYLLTPARILVRRLT